MFIFMVSEIFSIMDQIFRLDTDGRSFHSRSSQAIPMILLSMTSKFDGQTKYIDVSLIASAEGCRYSRIR
jgi:hypothetical protein